MKKLILLLFIPLVFACSSEEDDDTTDQVKEMLAHESSHGEISSWRIYNT